MDVITGVQKPTGGDGYVADRMAVEGKLEG